MIQYNTSYGKYILKRFPELKNDTLQAWSSADLYLLNHLSNSTDLAGKRILILNDVFGAITIPLLAAGATCFSISDSYISHCAYRMNCMLNGIDEMRLKCIDETQTFPDQIDIVLIKVPKSLSQLEDQLTRISPIINSGAVVVAAEKTKNIHLSTIGLFEKLIGVTQTTLAWKKSRLIYSEKGSTCISLGKQPVPIKSRYELSAWNLQLSSRTSVFSHLKLDHGTSFLFDHLRVGDGEELIIDLACGNGVIGLVAKALNPQARLIFVDESYLAVDSAKENYSANFTDQSAQFIVDDCLSSLVRQSEVINSVDRVLCNPPFHQHGVMGKETAYRMIEQAFNLLKMGGEMWVISNRHLAYHRVLARQFGHCEVVAQNQKFVVLRSIKRRTR